MGLTKTEINLRRLLAAMPEQTNQAKLAQYIAACREQLALLTGESGQGNLPSISAEKAKDYAEQIELAASKVDTDGLTDMWERLIVTDGQSDSAEISRLHLPTKLLDDGQIASSSSGLRKRLILNNKAGSDQGAALKSGATTQEDRNRRLNSEAGSDQGTRVKADITTLELIEKHRHLQGDLTDELVESARQMKEISLAMNRAVSDSEKVLDSTEQAVERSLASTNQANKRAQSINSQTFRTGCLTWLIIFIMCCTFILMVFLIRIT